MLTDRLEKMAQALEPYRDDDDWLADINCVLSLADADGEPPNGQAIHPAETIPRFTLAELAEQYPHLHEPVVDGLFRAGEVANIVSVSKVGKSWLAYSLLLSIATGRDWLDRFPTRRGKVLLIDNELHRPTIAHRLRTVADAMSIRFADIANDVDIIPLRGNLRSIGELAVELEQQPQGTYRAIIFDAKYRFAIAGQSENDNAAETLLYNTLDHIAETTGAALVLIHHSTKGDQAGKRVTDIGAGAGAQSRAADCHIVLREHEEPDAVVLEAAIRSFAPVDPLPLRWAFPLWVPNPGLDPSALKGRKSPGEERQTRRDREGCEAVLRALRDEPLNRRRLKRAVGFGYDRVDRVLAMLRTSGDVVVDRVETAANGTESEWYRLAESDELTN